MGRHKKTKANISTTTIKTEKVMSKKFKSGDKVSFICNDRDTEGFVDAELNNGIYRVKCGSVYVAVVGDQLSLADEVKESKEEAEPPKEEAVEDIFKSTKEDTKK